MAWDTTELDRRCGLEQNLLVVRYLKSRHPSAHSDVGSLLVSASGRLAGRRVYCPAAEDYAYTLLHDERGVIFALAVGMRTLLFRLRPEDVPEDLRPLLRPSPLIRIGWLAYQAFDKDVPAAEMRRTVERLCELALARAAEA